MSIYTDSAASHVLALQQSQRPQQCKQYVASKGRNSESLATLLEEPSADSSEYVTDVLRLLQDDQIRDDLADVIMICTDGNEVKAHGYLLGANSKLMQAPHEACSVMSPKQYIVEIASAQLEELLVFLYTHSIAHVIDRCSILLQDSCLKSSAALKQIKIQLRTELSALASAAKRYEIADLVSQLQDYMSSDFDDKFRVPRLSTMTKSNFPSDCTLVLGTLSITCHKCMLAARSEYFAKYFAHRWIVCKHRPI